MGRARLAPVLVAVGVAVLAAPAGAASTAPLRITSAVQVTKADVDPTRTYSSPSIAIDPENKMNVVAAYVEMRSRHCGLLRSTDGGRTWKALDASPSPAGYPFCFETSGGVTETPIAFGRNHTLYYGLVGWDTSDGGASGNMSVIVARSTNLGDSWSTTIVANARGKQPTEGNRPVSSIAVDTKHGSQDIVYVAWRRNSGSFGTPTQALVAASTDGGRTFGAPASIIGNFLDDPNNWPTNVAPEDRKAGSFGAGFTDPSIAIGGDGSINVLWQVGEPNFGTGPMYLSTSTDRGKSFHVVSKLADSDEYAGSMILKWSPEGGSHGSLHTVYEDKLGQTQGDRDVIYQRSTDGGKTWTPRRVINDDDPTRLAGQFLPNLAVAPNGRLDAVWWDFRDDPGTYSNDVYYSSSTDNGTTWSKNVKVNDRQINRKIGPWSNGFDERQPPGIAATNDYTVVAWDDTRNGDTVSQTQDIYSDAVQYKAIGSGTSKTAKLVLAGAAGLLVVGLILAGIALFTGRFARGGPPPQAASTDDRRPVGVG
jgi:photosystem II stability/assembly factor-like uncharacterized protein